MKKYAASALLILLVNYVIAQGLAVTNAILFHESGDLLKAKEQIDKASVHEKTSTSAKMWYYRGLIYMDMASSDKPEFKNAVPGGFKTVAEAFEKVNQYDKPNGEYVKKTKDKLYPLWGNLINTGYSMRDSAEAGAYSYYDMAQKLLPDSLVGYEYAIDLAYKKENYGKLKEYYHKMLLHKKNPEIYHNLFWVYQNIDKNDEKALEVAQEGRKEYPANGKLMEDEISSFIALKRIDEAQAKMEQAIQTDAKNPLLFFNLGTIYAKKGDDAKSLEYYNKALSLDPSSFETNFNLGAHFYNKAADIIKQTNKMTMAEYAKVGKKKDEEAMAYFKQGLPYLEKARSINTKEAEVKTILKDVYTRLKMNDKLNTLN